MKKTITVNLGGRAFQITEEAYAQLNDYLSSIADCIKSHEGGEEITADIESVSASYVRNVCNRVQ